MVLHLGLGGGEVHGDRLDLPQEGPQILHIIAQLHALENEPQLRVHLVLGMTVGKGEHGNLAGNGTAFVSALILQKKRFCIFYRGLPRLPLQHRLEREPVHFLAILCTHAA